MLFVTTCLLNVGVQNSATLVYFCVMNVQTEQQTDRQTAQTSHLSYVGRELCHGGFLCVIDVSQAVEHDHL